MTRKLQTAEIAKKREEFVEIALRILSEKGETALTLRYLGEVAGVSRSTPYRYFKDKRDLLLAMRATGLRQLTDRCRIAMADFDKNLERMRAMGHAYMTFGRQEPELYRLIFETGNPADDLEGDYGDVVTTYIAMADSPIDDAYAAGDVKWPASRLSTALWAATHGLIMLERAGHIVGDDAFHAAWDDVAEVVCLGFLTDEKRQEIMENRS